LSPETTDRPIPRASQSADRKPNQPPEPGYRRPREKRR
jgi:hypothetical protein